MIEGYIDVSKDNVVLAYFAITTNNDGEYILVSRPLLCPLDDKHFKTMSLLVEYYTLHTEVGCNLELKGHNRYDE